MRITRAFLWFLVGAGLTGFGTALWFHSNDNIAALGCLESVTILVALLFESEN